MAEDNFKDLLSVLPSTISFLFGDPITKGVVVIESMRKGYDYLKEMNQDWWDKLLTAMETVELIDDKIQSAEHIQFLRQVVQKVAYESRKIRREHLLNIAINYYHNKHSFSFDKTNKFLYILDNLSEEEVLYLIWFYKKSNTKLDLTEEMEQVIQKNLASYGLIEQNLTTINDVLQDAHVNVSIDLDSVKEGMEPDTSIDIDEVDLDFKENNFGKEFIDMILQ